jgi:hypothetical protein
VSDQPRPDFRITVRDLAPPGDVTTDVRLRRMLKAALRWFGFRCVKVEEVPRPGAGLPAPQAVPEKSTPAQEGR